MPGHARIIPWQDTHTGSEKTLGPDSRQRGAECGAGTVLCFMSSPTLSTAGTVTRQHGQMYPEDVLSADFLLSLSAV